MAEKRPLPLADLVRGIGYDADRNDVDVPVGDYSVSFEDDVLTLKYEALDDSPHTSTVAWFRLIAIGK